MRNIENATLLPFGDLLQPFAESNGAVSSPFIFVRKANL